MFCGSSAFIFMELFGDGGGDGSIQDATQETAKTWTAHKETAHAAAKEVVINHWSMSRYYQSWHAATAALPFLFLLCPPLSASSSAPLVHLCHIKRQRNQSTQGIVEAQGQSDSWIGPGNCRAKADTAPAPGHNVNSTINQM